MQRVVQEEFSEVRSGRMHVTSSLHDGASAHMSQNLIEDVIANDIILLGFPPKTPHLLQPCDVGLREGRVGSRT